MLPLPTGLSKHSNSADNLRIYSKRFWKKIHKRLTFSDVFCIHTFFQDGLALKKHLTFSLWSAARGRPESSVEAHTHRQECLQCKGCGSSINEIFLGGAHKLTELRRAAIHHEAQPETQLPSPAHGYLFPRAAKRYRNQPSQLEGPKSPFCLENNIWSKSRSWQT